MYHQKEGFRPDDDGTHYCAEPSKLFSPSVMNHDRLDREKMRSSRARDILFAFTWPLSFSWFCIVRRNKCTHGRWCTVTNNVMNVQGTVVSYTVINRRWFAMISYSGLKRNHLAWKDPTWIVFGHRPSSTMPILIFNDLRRHTIVEISILFTN